jgi:hypothetical protein
MQRIGEHDEQKILNYKLCCFIWNIRLQPNSYQLQISWGKKNDLNIGIKVTFAYYFCRPTWKMYNFHFLS